LALAVYLAVVGYNPKENQMRRMLFVAAAFFLPFLPAIPAAQAASTALCGNNGSGYCINAWNGGPTVKMYYGDYANDNFYLRDVSLCSGSDRVQSTQHGETTNCPFSNANLDNTFWNNTIVEAVYANNGACVGTSASGYGYLGSCGNSAGSGAIDGAFNVLHFYTGCGYALVNRYWTNKNGTSSYWASGGNPNTYLYVGQQGGYTCWGGSGI
jgi:hypothetical protein